MAKAAAKDYIIDQCIPRQDADTGEWKTYWRVYYWAERPDAADRVEGDEYHWHPDSEHETEAAAKERVVALKSGARKKSILVLPQTAAKPGVTKH